MKRTIIFTFIFLLVLTLGVFIFVKGMYVSNQKDEIKKTTTTTTTTETTVLITSYKDQDVSYWENKAREYYLSKNPGKDGIVVNGELNKKGINLFIMIGDEVIDLYSASNEDEYFRNLKGEKIILK